MTANDQLRSVQEAADRLAISPWTLRRAIRRGEVHAVRVGLRRILISEREIVRVIDKGTKKHRELREVTV
jgi:excisionase family DNA binding protein